MKRYITLDDLIDVYSKAKQRGWSFIAAKFNVNKNSRTISAFDHTAVHASNWWIIPRIRNHWTRQITGRVGLQKIDFLCHEVLQGKKGLTCLSIGCGDGTHERHLAQYDTFAHIQGIDLSPDMIAVAKADLPSALEHKLAYRCENVYTMSLEEKVDVVHFNSSLHHFDQLHGFVKDHIYQWLKPGGFLVIDEYVGPTRLQFPDHQIAAINHALSTVPKGYRQRFKSKLYKNHFYGSGLWRVIMADPSECVDSANLLPAVHTHFMPVVERSYGGNLLMNVLKDIAHHFVESTKATDAVIDHLIDLEKDYLETYPSDFVFGVYRKK